MEHSKPYVRTAIGGGAIFAAIGVALFARTAMLPHGRRFDNPPVQPAREQSALIASPNDPLMIKAIELARGSSKAGKGSNPWSSSSGSGATISFRTVGGSIALTREEIAEANFIYPQFVSRANAGEELIGSVSSDHNDSFDYASPGAWGNADR